MAFSLISVFLEPLKQHKQFLSNITNECKLVFHSLNIEILSFVSEISECF